MDNFRWAEMPRCQVQLRKLGEVKDRMRDSWINLGKRKINCECVFYLWIYIYISRRNRLSVQIMDTFIDIAKNGNVDLYLLKWKDIQDGFLSEK